MVTRVVEALIKMNTGIERGQITASVNKATKIDNKTFQTKTSLKSTITYVVDKPRIRTNLQIQYKKDTLNKWPKPTKDLKVETMSWSNQIYKLTTDLPLLSTRIRANTITITNTIISTSHKGATMAVEASNTHTIMEIITEEITIQITREATSPEVGTKTTNTNQEDEDKVTTIREIEVPLN